MVRWVVEMYIEVASDYEFMGRGSGNREEGDMHNICYILHMHKNINFTAIIQVNLLAGTAS